ncbi:NAD(P)H-binding protein [Mycolicibacterium pallens]|uniref:NAD(P)H-binding protein n=1 Tax=Mycolicibacterium pallens TaxID=370524 RepID=A0ABX8VJZ7_9MYCO|nr:NAD(P)H-binding protein [Mycolicibacterium pallens]QYL18129.1 NAD(P)H-binding protein [Mycolicibacterium pallens]
MKSKRILVTGATGYVGSRLVAALLDDGHEVVAATRNPEKLGRFGWCDRVTAVVFDADDPTSVETALTVAGHVDVIYYLVHAIGQPGFRERDNAAAANVAKAAAAAGVGRIVYLGGFVPEDDTLSEHLAGRAEVAAALNVEGGAELVWLGAAVIIGAGSTSFEMVRYVGDRFWVIPLPPWADHDIEPISIRDVLYYLVAAADPAVVPAGSYDIVGPDVTTYRELLQAYIDAAGEVRAGLPVRDIVPHAVVGRVAGAAVPVPSGLAADLIESLDHPMTASDTVLRDHVPDPPGGLTTIEDAVAAAVSSPRPRPVDQLADPHHLADSDPLWAGGDTLRLRRVAATVTPGVARPALRLLNSVPGPLAGVLRTGLDLLLAKVRFL